MNKRIINADLEQIRSNRAVEAAAQQDVMAPIIGALEIINAMQVKRLRKASSLVRQKQYIPAKDCMRQVLETQAEVEGLYHVLDNHIDTIQAIHHQETHHDS